MLYCSEQDRAVYEITILIPILSNGTAEKVAWLSSRTHWNVDYIAPLITLHRRLSWRRSCSGFVVDWTDLPTFCRLFLSIPPSSSPALPIITHSPYLVPKEHQHDRIQAQAIVRIWSLNLFRSWAFTATKQRTSDKLHIDCIEEVYSQDQPYVRLEKTRILLRYMPQNCN